MDNTNITEFLQTVDSIHGVYLDSTNGFDSIRSNFIKIQKLNNVSDEELAEKNTYYGKGNPNNKDSYPLHRCTQKEFKDRNESNGKNYQIIANLCLVQIYQFWETHYRNLIAEEMGKTNIEVNIMGDLKYLRESIIHHRGVAIDNIKKSKILKWFKPGDIINIDREKFEKIIRQIKNEVIEILA